MEFNTRNGIPDDLRPRFWFWLADMPKLERKFKGKYETLKNQQSLKYDEQILKDITRTFGTHQFFSNDSRRESPNSSDLSSLSLSNNSST